MMLIKKDFHGYRLEEAMVEFEALMHGTDPDEDYMLELITGRGVIRDAIQEWLDSWEVQWSYQGNNDGCIVAHLDRIYG